MAAGGTPRRRVERAMALGVGKPLDQFSSARECSNPTCSARLSRYNPNAMCAAHGGWTEAKQPRKRRTTRPAPADA